MTSILAIEDVSDKRSAHIIILHFPQTLDLEMKMSNEDSTNQNDDTETSRKK